MPATPLPGDPGPKDTIGLAVQSSEGRRSPGPSCSCACQGSPVSMCRQAWEASRGQGVCRWGWGLTSLWTMLTRPHQATCSPPWEQHPLLCVSVSPVPSREVTAALGSGQQPCRECPGLRTCLPSAWWPRSQVCTRRLHGGPVSSPSAPRPLPEWDCRSVVLIAGGRRREVHPAAVAAAGAASLLATFPPPSRTPQLASSSEHPSRALRFYLCIAA